MSLILEGIKKSYRQPGGESVQVLDVDQFELAQGEQVVLVGSSGGGKTTLLNVIAGITSPDEGKVVVDGTEITKLSEPARDRFRALRVGFVFQTFNLLQAFSALENVLLGMSFTGASVNRKLAKDLLDRVGLSHRLNNRPKQLSVGEQQRVAVARALANQPRLLLADEPTANVDSANQSNVLKLIKDACSDNSITLLMVTHAPEVASEFSRVEKLKEFNKAAQSPLTSEAAG